MTPCARLKFLVYFTINWPQKGRKLRLDHQNHDCHVQNHDCHIWIVASNMTCLRSITMAMSGLTPSLTCRITLALHKAYGKAWSQFFPAMSYCFSATFEFRCLCIKMSCYFASKARAKRRSFYIFGYGAPGCSKTQCAVLMTLRRL